MDRDAALAAFDTQLRNVARPSLGGGRFERVGKVIRCVSTAEDGWSGVEWSDLDESTADEVIAEQVAFFTGQSRTFEWKYYAYDKPANLPDRLRAAGLRPGEDEALMVAAVADIPTDMPAPEGIELRLATDDAGLELARQVHDEVFGGDHSGMIASMRDRLREDPDALAVVLAMAGDQPVCASRVDFHPGTDFASLWGGGTLPPWRRRGIYRAMVAYRTRMAADRGFSYLRTDALPPSRPILEKLGFQRISTTIPFTLPE
ncbi:MAG: GNAT family N-acetyltransferase [Actinophytocola sp.]|uniref:GNAT family N-acetyltransferase n=1 Tax=Actinophytocola sp. TaxID=1872138 RepID=UPI00132A4A2C|nr:GNAT family N-acetyltransferase [Actinophytocola sp.]MPZ84087.1 GNAT family N-acetyltransferase [Actinophytocola sp.]